MKRMCDAGCRYDRPNLQRAVGELRVSLKRRGAATVLDGLRQAGCLKARLPRPVMDGWTEVVTLNTSGGVAAGDRLDATFAAQPATHVVIATQAAERFYRAPPGSAPARLRTRITVVADAVAEWLPQETILFDRCTMDRRLEIDVDEAACFTGMETLVFGRTAMGERVQQAWVRDLIRIRRGGRLLLHDAVRLDGGVDELLQRPAIAGGKRAIATVVHVAPGAEQMLEPVRAALAQESGAAGHAFHAMTGSAVQTGVSAWDGMLVARILAADGTLLRHTIVAALHILRDARPLPRVWLC